MPSAVGTVGTVWEPQWEPHLSLIYRRFSHGSHSSRTYLLSQRGIVTIDMPREVGRVCMRWWFCLVRKPVGTVGTVGTATGKPRRYRKYSPFCGSHCGSHSPLASGNRSPEGER